MFNVAIWAAVSTKAQLDGVSIEDQISKGREWIKSRNAREAHPPLVVEGHSRDYVSVRDAEREIPELKTLFDLAEQKIINLVVVYNLNRFRRIMDQVYDTLALYGCQLYSLTQPVELQPPDKFTYYASDAGTMNIAMGKMQSNTENSGLRRKYFLGMPGRVLERGLPWTRPPYGYARPEAEKFNRRAVPEQIPALCSVLVRMKEDYLGGASAIDIARCLTEEGIASPNGKPRWHVNTVILLLTNPFYAGLVHYGRDKTKRDPRTGKQTLQRNTAARVVAQGKHKPLWSVEEWEAICERHKAVGASMTGKTKNTQRFSRLLVCGVCGKGLHSFRMSNHRYYRCRGGHCHMAETAVIETLRGKLKQLAEITPEPSQAQEPVIEGVSREQVEQALEGLAEQRARFQRAYGEGVLSYEDFKARQSELETQQRELNGRLGKLATSAKDSKRNAERLTLLQRYARTFDELLTLPIGEMNVQLHRFIRHITVKGNKITDITL
jgi:site-specific DNA recombinase